MLSSSSQLVWFNPELKNQLFRGAVFADRDGTLLKHVDYLGDPAKVELLPGASEAVKALIAKNYAFFIFTNQSGVGRGYYDLEDVFACHSRMYALLGIDPKQLAGYCIATGLPGGNDPYRKPSPLFIREATTTFSVQPASSHMVGDAEVDLEVAAKAGVHGWLVANGKPEAPAAHHAGKLPYQYHFRPDFAACVECILSEQFDNTI